MEIVWVVQSLRPLAAADARLTRYQTALHRRSVPSADCRATWCWYAHIKCSFGWFAPVLMNVLETVLDSFSLLFPALIMLFSTQFISSFPFFLPSLGRDVPLWLYIVTSVSSQILLRFWYLPSFLTWLSVGLLFFLFFPYLQFTFSSLSFHLSSRVTPCCGSSFIFVLYHFFLICRDRCSVGPKVLHSDWDY